ncbi:histone acetyltransferase [Favolaschia claudopus]|uniref:histone acetyltransferase n=1 Tax=Favolaschia claudopus TaxID=2862362 RepID=A0AAW0DPH2_9AGAR
MPATHTIPIPVGLPSGIVVKNGTEQPAQIISRAPGQLYVHYVNQDKRMDEWIPEDEFMPSATDVGPSRKRKRSQQGESDDEESMLDGDLLGEENGVERTMVVTEEDYDFEHHKQITAQRNFDKVQFGDWLIRTWYFSPYPLMENEDSELAVSAANALDGQPNARNGAAGPSAPSPVPTRIPGVRHTTARSHGRVLDLMAGGLNRTEKAKLWVCEYCFKYMVDPALYESHRMRCTFTRPPGRKVYQRGAHCIWEVDGAVHKLYCQNLSLFGKLFIDVKTLFFDCDNFMFYLVTDADSTKDHVYGFFSKEKVSYDDYNLACIITLPPWQRQGYGMLMIEFSYELSRRAGKVGTPERPLSDLGLRSYLAYWVGTLIRFFRRVLTVIPTGEKTTSRSPLPDLRSPSRDIDEEGTPSLMNGSSALSINGASHKRKKRTKGWEGEHEDLSFVNTAATDTEFLEQFRTFEITANPNGSATVDVVLRCTLRDIARATYLRVEDAAFALNEIGLLAMRLGSENPDELRKAARAAAGNGEESAASSDNSFVFISRAMVERVAVDRKVKVPCMDAAYVIEKYEI